MVEKDVPGAGTPETGAPEEAGIPVVSAERVARQAGGRRKSSVFAGALFWTFVLLGALMLGVSMWVRRSFGFISIDQLLSNLRGGGGEGAGGDDLVINGVMTGIVIPVLVVAVVATGTVFLIRKLHSAGALKGMRGKLFVAVALVVALAMPLSAVAHLSRTIGLGDYVTATVREAAGAPGMSDFYVSPLDDPATAAAISNTAPADPLGPMIEGKRRNLVVIYLESIEDAFTESETFERDMLEPVSEVTSGWATVPDYLMYEGGGWTMSGLVSTQCGIPLRTDESGITDTDPNAVGTEGNTVAGYLPQATCLGDVLDAAGYRSVFMGGALASFAGKGQFLENHGYDEVLDLEHWQEQGETEIRPDWGLSDRRLLENARNTLDELHAGDEPFNLTLLTLDTHEPLHAYDYCPIETEEPLTSITYCSMQQVRGFVEYMDEQGYLADTAVVIMGDHPKMTTEWVSFWDELSNRDKPRTIYNRIWSPDGLVPERQIDQLSMYPTILELVGLEIPDHRAGIGVSAFARAEDVPEGSILDLTKSEYSDVVNSRSTAFFKSLWGRQHAVEATG